MDVIARRDFPLPAPRVWNLLADFGHTDWLATFFCRVEVEGEGIGMVRKLYQNLDSRPAIHRLTSVDDDNMTISWSIHQTVFIPVDTIEAETTVEPVDDSHCRVVSLWRYDCPENADERELYTVTEQWMLGALTLMENYLLKA